MKLTDFQNVNAYLNRIGAEVRSLKKAVVRQEGGLGYWTDIAIIKFSEDGTVNSTDSQYLPDPEEQILIKQDLAGAKWPKTVNIPSDTDSNLPDMVKNADKKDVFWFKDVHGKILMAQLKKVTKGERSYIPVTLWDDGQYRFMEPEGELPLYGLESLKDNTTVFIHEGCTAARHAQSIANGTMDHPWSKELSYAAHVGFIGGALSPERTDWNALQKAGITRAIIVADNDAPGLSAVPKISEALRCKTQLLQFTDDWAKSSDIADPFPDTFFKSIEGKKYYIGPSYSQCLHPATYMTDLIPISEKKTVPVLRHHATGEWIWVEESELFVNSENPEIIRKADSLDAMLRPFSDTNKTSQLVLKSFTGRTQTMTYNPATTSRKILMDSETAINLYRPCEIIPQEGDITPFLEFIHYLIPNEEEVTIVLKWVATLIGKPERHIQFALLMISNAQGSGKSLLGEVLSRCVGKHNTSFPRETEILNQFTGWLARKRLIIINEVYSGANWKLANEIKTFITDSHVSLRLMYKDSVTMRNFANFYCCSNAGDAIKVDPMDRRWYIPTLTETVWPQERFDTFVDWLDSGGVSIIMNWAETHGEYFRTASKAPDSARKQDMIDESEDDAVKLAKKIGFGLSKLQQPAMIGYLDTRDYIKSTSVERFYGSDQQLQKGLKEGGAKFSSKRISLHGVNQLFIMNEALSNMLLGSELKDRRAIAIKHETNIGNVMDSANNDS